MRGGPLGKNIENKRRPIDNASLGDLFDVLLLDGGELIVENDGVNLVILAKIRNIL